MKVGQLYIVRIDRWGTPDKEVKEGSDALFDRNVNKGIPVVTLLGYDTLSGREDPKVTLVKSHGVARDDEMDVGVYVVGHCSEAEGLTGVGVPTLCSVIRRAGIKHIRKMCLLACNAAGTEGYPRPPGASVDSTGEGMIGGSYNSYLTHCCVYFGENGYGRILMAGWARYISINVRSNPHIVDKVRKDKSLWGKKVTLYAVGPSAPKGIKKNKDKTLVTPEAREQSKKYFVWTAENGVVAINYNEWHDA